MGLFDVEEFDEIDIDSELENENVNPYLADCNEAIGLISKIIPLIKNNSSKKTLKTIDEMLSDELLSVFKNVQIKNIAQLQVKLNYLRNKIVEQKKYEVIKGKAVIGLGGKFSAGKSKFINSLLKTKEELLPEDQNPTTSIPTYIVYGDKEEINAYTSNNNKTLLDINALQALTHKFYELYKIGFSTFVRSLIITEPDLPYKNLVFLDTPGYSKPDVYNETKNQKEMSDETKAYEQLSTVDYLIWLVDIENGVISESDVNFINKLNVETPILIVINKMDKKIPSDIKKTINLVYKTAKNAGINLYGVTAYSSRTSKEFENESLISSFLKKASSNPKSKDDLFKQIDEIIDSIKRDIDNQINEKKNERNNLSNIIFYSENIFEIKSLVEVYGETMETIRDLYTCKFYFEKNVKRIKDELFKHYDMREVK